jgi:hypothetical protein
MTVYHTSLPRFKPIQEIRFSTSGVLLSTSEARYDTLQEYIAQFAAPLSSLPGSGLYSFADPLVPECRLLVECAPEPWCERCLQALAACGCAF